MDELFLTGQKGSFEGMSQSLAGRLMVNGRWVQLHDYVDASYDQEQFDATYVCQENLAAIPKD